MPFNIYVVINMVKKLLSVQDFGCASPLKSTGYFSLNPTCMLIFKCVNYIMCVFKRYDKETLFHFIVHQDVL